LPNTCVIFVHIPVMARPLASSCMPLCDFGEGCVANDTVSPPATYAVQRFSVRRGRRRFRLGWQGQCGSSHSALCVPYAAERPSARRNWQPSARGAQSPHRTSRVVSVSFTTRSEVVFK
jgi:hypothetical protein